MKWTEIFPENVLLRSFNEAGQYWVQQRLEKRGPEMISQLTPKLENAYRVDLNHSGDYRFDLESPNKEINWGRVDVESVEESAPPTLESDFARSFALANFSTTGNNAGFCSVFLMRVKA